MGYIKTGILGYVAACLVARSSNCTNNKLCNPQCAVANDAIVIMPMSHLIIKSFCLIVIKIIISLCVQMLTLPSAALLQPRVSKSALASTQAGLQETMTCHRYPNIHPNIQIFQISIQIQSAAESVKASIGPNTSWFARNSILSLYFVGRVLK